MPFALGPIGQIARAVTDVDRAEAFYGGVLGLRKLFRFGDLTSTAQACAC
jgi:methylmalonyl-CoA/ethylmalonyl-CoA epimerase